MCLANAAQRTFAIYELTRIVADMCVDGYTSATEYSSQGVVDAAALALTCHATYGPAMDVIWFSLDTLQPLLTLVPFDAYIKGENSEILMTRRLSKTDISRFENIRSRVRRLAPEDDVDDEDFIGTYGNVLYALFDAVGREPLFPNLQSLALNIILASWDPSSRLFLSDSIHDIAINLDPLYKTTGGDAPEIARGLGRFVESCGLHCPLLSSISVDTIDLCIAPCRKFMGRISKSWAKLLTPTRHLMHHRAIVVPLDTTAAMRLLARELRTCGLNLDGRDLDITKLLQTLEAINATAETPKPWTHLSTLDINLQRMNYETAALVSKLRAPQLQDFTLTARLRAPCTAVEANLQAVASMANKDSLKTLAIRQVYELMGEDDMDQVVFDIPDTTYTVSSASLRHILCFRRLSHLDIVLDSMVVDNELVGSIAAAMPLLEGLHLISYVRVPAATCTALRLLNKNCPALSALSLAVDLRQDTEDLDEVIPRPLFKKWIVRASVPPALADHANTSYRLHMMWPNMKYPDWGSPAASVPAEDDLWGGMLTFTVYEALWDAMDRNFDAFRAAPGMWQPFPWITVE